MERFLTDDTRPRAARFFLAGFLLAVVLVAQCSTVFAQGHKSEGASKSRPPVEGDAALFDALADAYESRLGLYPHGAMEVLAEMGTLGPERPFHRFEGKFEWLGNNHRAKGHFTIFVAGKDGTTKEEASEIETVLSEKSYQVYDPTLRHLRIRSPNEGVLPLTRLQPDRSWFALFIFGKPWSRFLRDPTYQAGVERYRVRQPDAKSLEITVFRKGAGTLAIKSSTEWDWNVVEYHTKPNEGAVDASGTFQWERDRHGRVVLKERMETHTARGITVYQKLHVKEFDPDYRPPRELFLARIKPAPGTTVDDDIAHKSYRVGDSPVEAMGNRLNELIELMRSEGFARPR